MLLYQQIESNKRKTVFIVTGFIFFVLLIGASLTYIMAGDWISGAVIAGSIGLVYTLFTVFSSTNIVMRMNHAKEIKSSQDHPLLWHTVENLAMVARIPKPRIYIVHDSSPNAFATGISPKNGAVAVTSGLLERLNREEIEGVVAHEIAHIKNYDIRLATIAIALVSVIAILSDFGTRMLFFSRGGRGNNKQNPLILIIAVLLLILAPFIAMMIRFAISRNREYLADASGAELCRNPRALASALAKISGVKEPVREASEATSMLYIMNPLKKRLSGVMATHPPAEERIKRLNSM